MKISIADEAGICFGVKRTLEKVDLLESKNTTILGNLIHNPQVVDKIKSRGIKTVANVDDVGSGTLIISAHGISKETLKKAKEKGVNIVDTTCPLVSKVQEEALQIEKSGKTVIIIGDKNHSEVKGIAENLKHPIIVQEASELENVISDGNKYGIIFQTTQHIDTLNDIANIYKINPNISIHDTICHATKTRQEAAKKLAREVDIMIVIGGFNSANTKRLAETCKKTTKTYHIERYDELKKEWFNNVEHVGITAGASTPEWVINEIIEKIENEF